MNSHVSLNRCSDKMKKKWASVVGQSLACGTCGFQSALTDYDEQKGMSERKR